MTNTVSLIAAIKDRMMFWPQETQDDILGIIRQHQEPPQDIQKLLREMRIQVCWADKAIMPIPLYERMKVVIIAMGEASPQLADARLDGSEVSRSAVDTMEHTSPANPDTLIERRARDIAANHYPGYGAYTKWVNNNWPRFVNEAKDAINVDGQEHCSGATIKLLPCPWCGSEAKLTPPDETTKWWHILCSNNDCNMDSCCACDTEDEALKLWNTRAPYNNEIRTIERQKETIRCMSQVFDDLALELKIPPHQYGDPDLLFDAIEELKSHTQQPDSSEITVDEAVYGYASRLFKHVAPQCEPLPTTLGVLTQIDNYIASWNKCKEGNAIDALDRIKTDLDAHKKGVYPLDKFLDRIQTLYEYGIKPTKRESSTIPHVTAYPVCPKCGYFGDEYYKHPCNKNTQIEDEASNG